MSNDDIHPSDVADAYHYHGQYRPQFHYTPMQGHIGDATGLIYYKGEYHLFYMYDPWSMKRAEHKNWGHAVSHDCLHWRELPPILDTLIDHRPGSGGGIIDWNNSSGLRPGIEKGGVEKTLIVFYTDYVLGTCIAYSNDKGRTWIRHRLNPILEGAEDIRDPYVFWYKPARGWRMVRYEKKGFAFYASTDLLTWHYLSRVDGFYECPDLFELPVDGDPAKTKWVLIDGDGTYLLGTFDGTRFQAETEKLQVNFGRLYATQSWKHTFEGDGPVIQLAFVGYIHEPRLTWIGQMSFPCELTLRTHPDGVRLFRYPLHAIKHLYREQRVWHTAVLPAGVDDLDGTDGDVLDIHAEIEPAGAQTFGFEIRGERIAYHVQDARLSWRESAPLALINNRIRLRILLDRSSIEVFGNDGSLSFTDLFFPDASNRAIKLFAEGGDIRLISLEINHLESIWQARELALGVLGTD